MEEQTLQSNTRVFSSNPQDNLARFGTVGVSGPNIDSTQGLTDAQIRVLQQQRANDISAPSPFTVNLANIPSNALSSSISRNDVINARTNAETSFRTTLAEQNALQNKILEVLQPTQLELDTERRIRESQQAEERGLLGATERGLGTTRIARAVQGEQALITNQEQARRKVLAAELGALVQQREVQLGALTTALEFSQENLAALQTLQQLTKPDVLNTQVDKVTGQIIATVQDPDGNIRTQLIGTVTPEVQAKTLNNTGTFTDDQGNLVFFGTDETGQIIKQVVGKEQVDPRTALDLQIKRAQLAGVRLDNERIANEIKEGNRGPIDINQFEIGTPEYTLAVMANSAQFDKNLTQNQLEKVEQALGALGGIETLNSFLFGSADSRAEKKEWLSISGSGPLKGRARTLMAQLGEDADAAAINATIQGLIPTVARGIFGEVGVLTDVDIQNYKQTIASLSKTEDQNKLVSVIMLDVLARTMGNTLKSAANNQQDVSRFVPDYENMLSRVQTEKAKLFNVQQQDLDIFDDVLFNNTTSTPLTI